MPSPLARVRHVLVPCALLVLLLCSTATATPGKPFLVGFSEPSAVAGVTSAAFEVEITNDSGTQELGSANVTPPAQFTVVGTPTVDRGRIAGTTGTTLQLRDLDLPPGGAVTLTLGLRRPCVAGTYQWTVTAKQSNDYLGEGNALDPPVASALQNQVTGQCALRFTSDGSPARAEKNQPIRAVEFQPASTKLVSVEAVDGRAGSAAQRLTWFTGSVATALAAGTPGELVQPGPVSAQAGVARFANLSITAAGTYSLRPSTTSAGFATAAASAEFKIVDELTACGGSTCSATLGQTTITASGGTGSGFLTLSSNVGTEPECTGYTPPPGSSWYEFDLTAQRDKLIAINYTKAQMRTIKRPLEVCFAAPGPPFDVKAGTGRVFDYDGLEGWIGLLPDCPAVRTSACVTRRGSLKGGGAFIEFFAPRTLGDPRYH